MVVVSIMTLIFILGSEFVVRGFKALTFGSEQDAAVQNARRVMDIITSEIRETSLSERGNYPISSASEQTLTLYSDIDKDGKAERVRYFIDDRKFKKSVTLPGVSNDYTGPENIEEIARYINNNTAPLFFYYDINNATTTTINNIRMVKVSLLVNVTPNVVPNDYTIETNITLRNLKDGL